MDTNGITNAICPLSFIFLLIDIPFLKKKGEGEEAAGALAGEREMPEPCEDHELSIAVYKKILARYHEQIEKNEYKTISELRALVNPSNPAVQETSAKIREEFHPYIYDNDFLAAAEKAYDFIKNDIKDVALPLDFWLSPEDILELRAADETDKAIFLCSLLVALDNADARVVVETNGERHVFVIFEFNGIFYLMDPVHDVRLEGAREEVLKAYFADRAGNRLVYEFNDRVYEEK
ncbi:MAG: hypothetical protein AB1468_01205 [Candidatus Micrarchaeota archaeon]